jgi:hypothetical protein
MSNASRKRIAVAIADYFISASVIGLLGLPIYLHARPLVLAVALHVVALLFGVLWRVQQGESWIECGIVAGIMIWFIGLGFGLGFRIFG